MFNALASQQVSWWEVHEFIAPWLDLVGDFPLLGSPTWCSLPHADPAKWTALLDGAQHWALRVESCQEARSEAGAAVSAAADWAAIGRERLQLNAFYAERPWLKRAGGGHV